MKGKKERKKEREEGAAIRRRNQVKGYSNMYAKRNVLARIGLRLKPISIACLHSLAPSLQRIEYGYEIQGWPT
jgi:hypothetical protein